jgi:hypothetical protein
MIRANIFCLLCLACHNGNIMRGEDAREAQSEGSDLQGCDDTVEADAFRNDRVGSENRADDTNQDIFPSDFLIEEMAEVSFESDEPKDVAGNDEEDVEEPIPPKPRITINGIPDYMNGKEPYSQFGGEKVAFHVAVSSVGFTVEVYNRDEKARWLGDVRMWASQDLLVGNTWVRAFETFSHVLSCGADKDPMLRDEQEALLHTRCFLNGVKFPLNQMVTVFAGFEDSRGILGETDEITFEVRELTEDLDPFEREDVWFVLFSRDIMSHELVSLEDGTNDVLSMIGANGIPDFDEALRILGLLSENEGFSQRARRMFIEKIRGHVARIFGLDASLRPTDNGVRLRIFFEGDEGAPDPKDFREDGDFSMIAVGSDPALNDIPSGIVGRAWIDWNNRGKEDDSVFDFGVFVTQIVRQALKNPLGAAILREISPNDGVPFGMFEGDEAFLGPQFDPSSVQDERLRRRAELFKVIMQFASLGIAVTLCHEMGHSLGLVPSGAPPEGLFGGMDGLNFTVSDAGYAHIDTPGLNIMQTGKVTSYFEFLDADPRFNELNLAYLRRRIVVGSVGESPNLERSNQPCGIGIVMPYLGSFMLRASEILGR